MLRCPRTHSGRAWVPPGRSVRTVGCFTDGHGRGPRPRTSHGRGPRGARCAGLTFAAELSVHVPASARCPAGFPGRGGRGRAGAVMARVAVRETVTLAGRAERARAARAFVAEVLGPGHPCGDVAVLLVSEIFGNSVRHSGSGAPGETVTVAVRARDGIVRVEVTDRAGPGTPELSPPGGDAEGGRGLQLVAILAARWGWMRRGGRMVTWFELQALLRLTQHSAVSGQGLTSPDAGARRGRHAHAAAAPVSWMASPRCGTLRTPRLTHR
jgi:anti-sigma regulatory factor (Ser/Thr protein kinase)